MSEKTTLPVLTDRNFRREVLEYPGFVLVEFVAEWCGNCRIVYSILGQLSGLYREQIKICKVDIERERNTAAEYGIRDLPTCILFANGNVVDLITGIHSRDAITAWLDPLVNADQ